MDAIKSFDNFYRMSVNFDYGLMFAICIENWKKIRYKNLNGCKSLLSRYDLMIKILKYSSLIHKSQADECFKYRPRIINMSSDYIEKNESKSSLKWFNHWYYGDGRISSFRLFT